MKNITSIAMLDDESSTIAYNGIVLKHSNFEGALETFSKAEEFISHALNADLDHTSLLIIDLINDNFNAFHLLDTLRRSYPFPSYRVIVLGIMIQEKDIEQSNKYEEIVRVIEKPLSIPVLNDILTLNLAVA